MTQSFGPKAKATSAGALLADLSGAPKPLIGG